MMIHGPDPRRARTLMIRSIPDHSRPRMEKGLPRSTRSPFYESCRGHGRACEDAKGLNDVPFGKV